MTNNTPFPHFRLSQAAFGIYDTNCYVLHLPQGQLIIDPGHGATHWVLDQCDRPLAILNTHGHWDHVWSNAELQKTLKVPLYCPVDDAFLLEDDPFHETPPSHADVWVQPDQNLLIEDIAVTFHHFPGHTPGCSMIEVNTAERPVIFSGDFIFKGNIGRYDFPYASAQHMRQSLEKFAKWQRDAILYPGHGDSTTIAKEQQLTPKFLRILQSE